MYSCVHFVTSENQYLALLLLDISWTFQDGIWKTILWNINIRQKVEFFCQYKDKMTSLHSATKFPADIENVLK